MVRLEGPFTGALYLLGMDAQFYILFSLKTPNGYENYGQYFLGDDRAVATELFSRLSCVPPDNAALHMDLMETVDELPVKIKTIGCTLDDFALNHKLIALAVFRRFNLGNLI